MDYIGQRKRWIALLLCLLKQVSTQIKYSVPEEMKEGSVVGNIAKDLGLDVSTLADRRFRIVSGYKDDLFKVHQNNGVLYIQKKIDREEICYGNNVCLINLKIAVENPLEIHYIGVEIIDINDHAPRFAEKHLYLEVPENKAPGARLDLQPARDPDVGTNSIRSYKIRQNEYFSMELRGGDEEIFPSIVLQKYLDRESVLKHDILVTAIDGGNPPKSGNLNITITVLDVNDNQPLCSQDLYSVFLPENVSIGTIIMKVNATDLDDGSNGEVEYSWGRNTKENVQNTFQVDRITGELRVKAEIDFEDNQIYRINIQASDKGQPPLSVDCRVVIRIIDVNDNTPEIEVTSILTTVPEDAKPGTVISLISVTDKDSGINGKVNCSLSNSVPFELKSSVEDMYSLITKEYLDRELVAQYDILLVAKDMGQPILSSLQTLRVLVSDVNDNIPEFPQNPLEFYLIENNLLGTSLFSVRATDKDLNENAALAYHIIRGDGKFNDVSAFFNINPETGVISALKSFDFEVTKRIQFHVLTTDSGTPPLSSNVTVNVFILDQNDNAPVIMHPVSTNGTAKGVEEIPLNVNAGHLVTKVRAYDADIGYNGWLLFSLQEVSDHTLFGLDRYTGQIRTLRSFTETDEAEHKLVIMVKDNGNVSLSATATLIIKFVETKEAFATSDDKSTIKKEDEEIDVSFYLIITLGSVSVLFIISIIVLVVMQCSKSTDYSSKYLQDTNYDGTLCHSIQYKSGDKRYMLVGPRMSIGSTVVPGNNGNTLVVSDHRREASVEVRK